MNVPGKGLEPEQPHGGKWDTIRYAISGWDTTVRLLLVLIVLMVPIFMTILLARR